MAEPALNVFQTVTTVEQWGRHAVPEVMETDVGQTALFQNTGEMVGDESGGDRLTQPESGQRLPSSCAFVSCAFRVVGSDDFAVDRYGGVVDKDTV